jgi:hypothetical protein
VSTKVIKLREMARVTYGETWSGSGGSNFVAGTTHVRRWVGREEWAGGLAGGEAGFDGLDSIAG